MPTGEDDGDDVAQVYEEVRETIALGERIFRQGVVSTDKANYGVWKETCGVYATNQALRDGHQVEYEVFIGQDVADGLQEAWRRPMHWAGFLVMGANTHLPRGVAKQDTTVSVEDNKTENKEQLMQELKDLKTMHDQEIIDADEFKEMKTVILQKLKGCY